ncbi:VOC family protein [Cellulomonas sp. PhB143]|uniref:VOC family protein n=1 Tax=Cellulomonas sp. PhB143 TaxID=2485186 RepID=UPI000F48E392|nr:VOC family protein [Cellulomonas sp. PhB143]ROS75256.1 catechol 2,3-dioxygenase-like lactoylglutathione lyase family enzyme [Cellulomonas sp. PhB143]
MFSTGFSGFSVDDVGAARRFYADVLGLRVEGEQMLRVTLGPGRTVLIYPKGPAHVPASFTVLNLVADDVAAAVAELRSRGVEFETYEGTPMQVDDDGVFRGGPDPDPGGSGPEIAWFTDPAGNVLSVIGDDL